LRIGLPEPVLAAPMESAIRAAWDQAAQRLRDLGAIVAPVAVPGWDPGAARRAGLLLIEAEAAALHEALIADPAATSPGFRAALQYGRDAGTVRLARALFRLAELRAGASRALDACDALLLPTAPQRAFAFGTKTPADQADFTALANVAGLPAIAIPWPSDDLPASVQLVGRAYDEARIVGLAEALSAP
jgi:aspartyl-tRNA(Asn)/glutamyl-tRNA(Gln) amidotransferase subunit A